jgi:predicted ATP-grasp superfamily ATP-dependent carboligase
MKKDCSRLPPVILLGGAANALSVARSLGRAGVRVFALNEYTAAVRFSRYCRWLPVPWTGSDEDSWANYLLGRESDPLRGAVLLTCSDVGIQILARHREALARKFRLDDCNPAAQLDMLNKLSTYRQAVAAGVPTPRFWLADSRTAVLGLKGHLTFPLIVKPVLSHVFGERFGGKKFFVADHFDDLIEAYGTASAARVETMLVEMIPGPDSRLCSYYTYLDHDGRPLFDFTKRIIRRFPVGSGEGCCHVTDWNPEVRELALKLFQHAGLRGLANAEFKRDERDGRLKLIECNARFTAANCLVADSGFDLGLFVYNRLVGRPQPPLTHYVRGMRLWSPWRDLKAFLELRRRGELTLWQWLGSVLRPHTVPYFRWYDPLPTVVAGLRATGIDALVRGVKRGLQACVRRVTGGLARRRSAAQETL